MRVSFLALVGAVFLLAALAPGRAQGGAPLTFVVNDSGDGAPGACNVASCTLREAIIAANSNPFADIITFDLNVFPSNGVILYPNTQMDFIDARDGITIDATGTLFGLQKCALCNFNFGFVFYSPSGMPAKNIVVRNLIANDFNYDGIQVCGGLDVGLSDCISDVSGVDIKNTTFADNNDDGLRILGDHISNVTLDGLQSTSNDVSGIDITAKSTLTGVTVTGGNANQNGDIGLRAHGGGTTSQISVSGLTVNGNGGSGISLSSTGGSMPSTTVTGVTANGNGGHGIEVNSSAGLGGSITGSTTMNNTLFGIYARGGLGMGGFDIAGNTVDTNKIGIDAETGGQATGLTIEDNTVTNSTNYGIYLVSGSASSTNNVIRRNTLTGNGLGIQLATNAVATISRNTIHDNDNLGIDLASPGDPVSGVTPNDAGDSDSGPNDLLNFPEWIVPVGYSEAVGTACANCLVEVFRSDNDPSGYGEGKEFLLERTADAGGHFSIDLCPLDLAPGTLLTATATDGEGNTSEFSANYEVLELTGCPTATPSPSPTASPTPSATPSTSPTPSPTAGPGRKQGDLNCDGKIDALDALLAILAKFGLSITAASTCGPIGSGSPKFGDVNCDGVIDERDGLAILAFVGKVTPQPQQPGCKAIGEILS